MLNGFTLNDIHRIRYENYEKTKNLSHKELIARTKKEAASGWAKLEKLKENRVKV